ncbi:MAG: thiamine phosphate synthase [Bacteroidetes bacterium]|nr:thiamine phosphate synthase [Bacteroidota bacterium]
MQLIVISSPTDVPNEHEIINSLFEEGLEMFQLHKPTFSKEEIKQFVQQIPFKYHNRISLHSDFPKFHSLKELEEHKEKYEYAFLSPIFDGISKVGYKSNFDLQDLKNSPLLRRGVGGEALIALGGIDEDKIEICSEVGFAGVAVLGAIWKNSSPVEKYKSLKAKCQKKDLVF